MVAEYLMDELPDVLNQWVDEHGVSHDSRDCVDIVGTVAPSEGALAECECHDRQRPDHDRHSRPKRPKDRYQKVTTAKTLREANGAQRRDMARRYAKQQEQTNPNADEKPKDEPRPVVHVAEVVEVERELSDGEIAKQALWLAARLLGRLAVLIGFAVTATGQSIWRAKAVKKWRRKARKQAAKLAGPTLFVVVAVVVAAVT